MDEGVETGVGVVDSDFSRRKTFARLVGTNPPARFLQQNSRLEVFYQ